MLPNAVAQALGGRYPKVVPLEVNPENVVMRGRAFNCYLLHSAGCVANQHLGLVGLERRPIDSPVRAIVVSQSFIGREPGAIAVHGLNLVEEVTRQAAVLLQEVMPVSAIIAAGAEVSRDPEDLVDIADRCRDLVDQSL